MTSKSLLKMVPPLVVCLLYLFENSEIVIANRSSDHSEDRPSSFQNRLNHHRSSHHQNHHQHQHQQQTSMENHHRSSPQGCRGCSERRANLSKQTLKQLRYDIVKNQFLRKLQMTEEPRLQGVPRPPIMPLLVAAEMGDNATLEERTEADREEDNVEKTDSIVIYPSQADFTCLGIVPHPCVQLQFRLSKDVGIESFASSELWIYKTEIFSLFQLTELAFAGSDVIDQTDIYRDRTEDLGQESGEIHDVHWTKYQLPTDVLWSNAQNDYVLTLQLKCLEGCPLPQGVGGENGDSIISETGDQRPFLVIRTVTSKGPNRNRRSVDCVEGKPGCCRETFYLNFSELGWDNWILHPEGYYANFCRGRCVNDLSNMRFYHSAVLISYIQDNEDIAAEMGLNMCCTPSAMSSVSIIYMNEAGDIYHKSIENMKVESCDCA